MDSKVPGLGDNQTEPTQDDITRQPDAPNPLDADVEPQDAAHEPAESLAQPHDEVAETEATASQQTSDLSAGPEADAGAEAPQADAVTEESEPEADAAAVSPPEAEEPEPVAEADAGAGTPEAEAAPPTEAAGEPERAAAQEPAPPAEDAGAPRLKRGSLVQGTITETAPTQVVVDLGEGLSGIIPGHELEKMTRAMLDSLREGEQVDVFVVNARDHQGNVILSVNRALEELDWRRAEEFQKSQEVYETHVAGYNKGGLIVRFGRVRGFVPQSQMSADRRRLASGETPEERWGRMVNEPIAVKVMEVDRARNRLILSERSATRESRERRKEHLISQLTVGEVRTGRVVSLEDFGAFVDIGGAEGLVHLTELSWKHVNHPREMLKVGQEVRVEVISIDPDQKRIGLSIKSQEPDPWDVVAIQYNVGQLVRAIVTKLTKFGAFARLAAVPEIEGLIHISELSDKRVNHPREVVEEGDHLTLRVVKMDIANRRLGLSLKKVNSPEYLDQDWAMSAEDLEAMAEPEPPATAEPEAEPDVAEPVVEDSAPVPDADEAAQEPETEPVLEAAAEDEPADDVTAEPVVEAAVEDEPADDVAAEPVAEAAAEVEPADDVAAEPVAEAAAEDEPADDVAAEPVAEMDDAPATDAIMAGEDEAEEAPEPEDEAEGRR